MGFDAELENAGLTQVTTGIRRQPIPDEIAGRLRLPYGSEVVVRARRMGANEQTLMLSTSCFSQRSSSVCRILISLMLVATWLSVAPGGTRRGSKRLHWRSSRATATIRRCSPVQCANGRGLFLRRCALTSGIAHQALQPGSLLNAIKTVQLV